MIKLNGLHCVYCVECIVSVYCTAMANKILWFILIRYLPCTVFHGDWISFYRPLKYIDDTHLTFYKLWIWFFLLLLLRLLYIAIVYGIFVCALSEVFHVITCILFNESPELNENAADLAMDIKLSCIARHIVELKTTNAIWIERITSNYVR